MEIKTCLDGILTQIESNEWMPKEEDEMIQKCLDQAPTGLIMEFGVAGGGSFRRIIERTARDCYGFDSFEGLPADAADGWYPGIFACSVPSFSEENAHIVEGLIQNTLPGFLSENEGQAAFVHIDTDIYSSAKYVLETLYDAGRIASGTLILFDEIFTCESGSYPSWPHHEYKAFVEFGEKTGVQIETFGRRGPNSYVFKIL
jgi:hypothetical protein